MNLDKAKREFIKYTNNYDVENPHIFRKIGHSIRVMEISRDIAKSLNLTEEQVDLATLIGLLHDIARFEQMKRYATFKDKLSIDHGDLGVEILKENNFIRKFIEEDKYDNIILIAIKNHNKYAIQEVLNEEELLFSKIIRDADKLDIIYEGVELFWQSPEERERVNKSKLTQATYEMFINEKQIERGPNETIADSLMGFVSFIFDIYFKYDFIVLKKEDYINKILDKFNFEDVEVKEKFINIRNIANRYIEKRNEG